MAELYCIILPATSFARNRQSPHRSMSLSISLVCVWIVSACLLSFLSQTGSVWDEHQRSASKLKINGKSQLDRKEDL